MEDGYSKDCTTFVGQAKRSIDAVTEKKALKSTGFTTVLHGGKSDPRGSGKM